MESTSQSASPDRRLNSISPSLARSSGPRRARAYEVKFVLEDAAAVEVERCVGAWLRPDPHADPSTGAYSISTVYCDTPAWDVYFREGLHGTHKHRVRRYGAAGPVFLERKTVRNTCVRKRRIAVETTDLSHLIASEDGGPGTAWFTRQVARAGLRPVCRVSYLRRALFGECSEGPMRVTFDRAVRGHPVSEWGLSESATARPLLEGIVVCEFKFRNSMPAPMKEVAAALRLESRGVSKYRACIGAFAEVLGLPARGVTNA